MTSSEPILPVAPTEGLLVSRAEPVLRVSRRSPEDEDDAARDQRRAEDRRHDALAAQHERIWTIRPDVAPEHVAGSYDDHGRTAGPEEAARRRHLDASA